MWADDVNCIPDNAAKEGEKEKNVEHEANMEGINKTAPVVAPVFSSTGVPHTLIIVRKMF